MRTLIILVFLTLSSPCLAEHNGSTDSGCNRIKHSETQQTIGDFGGWLLITSDMDWREKWNTPPEVTPKFTQTDTVKLGETISILTFYTNPDTDESNHINITCDIEITRPDGSTAVDLTDVDCANEELSGNPANIRLTYAVVEFVGELGDPFGTWQVEVVLKDNNSNIHIPLTGHFELTSTRI